MERIFLFFLMLSLAGCASAAGRLKAQRSGADSKKECVAEMQGSNVYGAIKCLLASGATVYVLVDYQSSFDGLPEGYGPADFGAEADSEMIIETEKIFLLESFARYPNFSVIDRSRMDASFTEIKLGMNAVTASNVRPGEMSGASHLIVIEGKNHFFRQNSQNKDRYTEIKKFLDIQKDVVVAMDKLSEQRDVEYRGRRSSTAKTAGQPQDAEPAQETRELQQLPPRIEMSPPPERAEKVETITIYGNHLAAEPASRPEYAKREPETESAAPVQEAAPRTVYVQSYSTGRKIPDWQFARIVKQRFPEMKNKDNGAVVRHFIQAHPEYKERIIMTPRNKNPLGM